jgi:hypothetical protein
LLEIAGRGKVEASNSNESEILFSSVLISHIYLVNMYLNFRKFVCVGFFICNRKNVNLRRDENYTIVIYVVRTKKKIFWDDFLETAGEDNFKPRLFIKLHRLKKMSSLPWCIITTLVICNKNTRKNFHSVVKVTFDP